MTTYIAQLFNLTDAGIKAAKGLAAPARRRQEATWPDMGGEIEAVLHGDGRVRALCRNLARRGRRRRHWPVTSRTCSGGLGFAQKVAEGFPETAYHEIIRSLG